MKPKVCRVHSRAKPVVARFKQISAARRRSKFEQLRSLGESIVARFEREDGTSDTDEAIIIDRQIPEPPCLPGDPNRSASLADVSLPLRCWYKLLRETTDLQEGIVLAREGLELYPPEHLSPRIVLAMTALWVGTQHSRVSRVGSIILEQEAVKFCTQRHCDGWVALNKIAFRLSARYNQLGEMADLDEAIVLGRDALELRPQGHPDRSTSLNNLGVRLSTRYNQLRAMADLDEAIVLGREALELRPQGHPDRSMSLSNLGVCLSTRYNQLGEMADLDEAIVLGREALELCPQGHPDRSMSLSNLGVRLSTRYDQLGAMADLDEAIALGREALELRLQGHPDRSTSLNNLGAYLSTRFKQLGAMVDLDEAIALGREALELRPQGHTDRSTSLSNLGVYLSTRYNQLGAMADLDEAIVLGREALELDLQGHPHRSMPLSNLGVRLSTRYNQLGAMSDLDEAIVLDREALELHLQGHPDRSTSLNNLGAYLSTRYNQLGAMADLDEAIVLGREALELRPQGHPDRSMSLSNLGVLLSTRYDQLGAMADLDEAIVLDREALELRLQGHPHRSMSLSNLGAYLSTRFKQLGAMVDLDEAIVLGREALELDLQGHPDRSMPLSNLGVRLSTRYNQLGAMSDLDEAIVLDREALELHLQGHPDRSTSLNNLGAYLSTRYNQLGAMADLDEAIVLGREALELRPQGHPDRSMSLSNLGVCLSTRYNQLGAMSDLDEAIVLDREALELRLQGHPHRSMSLSNLGVYLSTRYDQLGAMADLDEAIVLGREALELDLQGHPDRSMSLSNLGVRLSTRYNQLGAMSDLDEAIVLGREALELRPQGHPRRSMSLSNLASALYTRFMQLSQADDKKSLFSLYAQLVDAPQLVSSTDLSTARAWIRVAEEFQHPSTLLAYETSLRLLIHHLATLPLLPQHLIILKERSASLAVDAFSACLRRGARVRAVELLEQGRSVFWNQLSRLRFPLDDIMASGPAGRLLADEFMHVASLIRIALNAPGADQHGRLCHLNLEMQRTIINIRELPGFSHFLLPSCFSDLQRAVSGGPVIIVNASQYSCDVLVVLLDRDPVHIPLQITKESVHDLSEELHASTERAKKVDVTRELGSLLRTLWDHVVSPVVEFLLTTLPLQSRIWWCPTAEFSVLPLHAAGPYRKGERNLSDLYISSYTPTLSALIRARRPAPSNTAVGGKRFIAIGQANAIGQVELLSVGTELANIGQRIVGLAGFTQIEGPESCISRVAEELCKTEWVHLACHGLPNRTRPFESAFALHDGRFTIQRIIGCDLKNPEFAYLSACHTTVGDEESPDEVIHLASAMQFAGFRSVIGTMWAVDDAETNKITSTFYKHMVDESGCLDYTRAAFALHKTMRSVNVPLDQRILYIHLGA
ncbi:CHAT domain-containing protein [Boletus edulis BED1]|uniref:CHAT domain-containing protein n=1 Tax=Boletus edulis BED1 TaxID=1328754 RepID=A0AAD4BP73_BOLED|nr:CHAT domain-containing protein [Boletus edulis BED1]